MNKQFMKWCLEITSQEGYNTISNMDSSCLSAYGVGLWC